MRGKNIGLSGLVYIKRGSVRRGLEGSIKSCYRGRNNPKGNKGRKNTLRF